MTAGNKFDVAIVGGGLAGLALAIQLASKRHTVILFEKERYPFHKVCGEYISLESESFLKSLAPDLPWAVLPRISTLQLTGVKGTIAESGLPLGGFGISRYLLDGHLAEVARRHNVVLHETTKVTDIVFDNDQFTIYTGGQQFTSRICCGSFGKRSNIDVKMSRQFIRNNAGALNNFIAVKYHAVLNHPKNTIALHHFYKGYCGISPIEANKYCICYLTTADNLRESGNSIAVMQEKILSRNPLLRQALAGATILYERPLTISQVSFDKKKQVENHMLMVGDAAGMITPLCGNGMSMALHASQLAAHVIDRFVNNAIDRADMELKYTRAWNGLFASRLAAGRTIQRLFGNEFLTNITLRLLKQSPSLLRTIIGLTHGREIPVSR